MKRLLSALLIVLLLVSVVPVTYAVEDTPAVVAEAVTDSDYDGIPDAVDADPNSNTFSGTYKSGNYTINMTYTMDYRNFFGNNKVYNEGIAGFSTWAAQFAYEIEEKESDRVTYTPAVPLQDSDGSTISKVYHVDELMRAHGMEDVIDYRLENGYFDDSISLGAYADDDITEVFFGHHNVTYNGETIEVIAIFVRGTNATEKEWCSNFDVGDLNRFGDEYDCVEGKSPRQLNGSWNRKSNHRGFDVCSNRIRVALQTYMDTYLDGEATPVFWLTGHSRGAAIANIISSYLVDETQKVFAYTFASPNTTANTEASAEKYDCIFNLVNGDDFVPMLPMPEWGFTRYGRSATIYASSVSSSDRSSLLSNTSYSYSSDLQTLVNKFVNMTKNNAGKIEGWRDVYVYHCCNEGSSTASYHHHAGETIGEYRSNTWMDFFTDSNWNGYNEHTKKYSYCVKDNNGWLNKYACCQTPAYAMQILAITMGNLGLSAGWDFLTSYKLADKFDFGKTSLITSYATKIIDPHYMENYYLIQTVLERDGDPDTAFSTASSLYTDNGRPVHTHNYTFYYYEGKEPTCTQEGEGYKVCNCSQINSDWYDDVVNNVKVPALGHSMEYTYAGSNTHTVSCQRGDLETVTEACVYDENNVCTLCGHVKAASRTVSVYVVDELNGESVYAWAWGEAGNLDAAWPGHALTAEGTDKGNHPYYKIELDVADYDKIIFNRNGQPETATLNVAANAGENNYVVYYIYGVNGNDLQASQGTDIWPAPGVVTVPTCTEGGYTTYTGMFTGETRIENETPALGHNPGEPVRENEVPATCSAEGSYDEVVYCQRCGEELSRETKTIVKTAHTPAEPVIENNVDPTCTEAGHYDSVVYCTECGEEISRETVTVPALGHTPAAAVKENETAATCTTAGGYDMVVNCSVCNEELSREHTEIPATGHAYGAPEWTWTADNTAATAKFTCANCGDVQTLEAVITETVLTEAKPHVAGQKKLTAKVTFNETAYTDEKTVEIEALPCPCADFTDMPAYGTPEHEAIDWAFVNGITAGLSATEFGTNKTLNRAQAATFLYAAAGKPEVDSTATVSFNDVVPSNWYYTPVLWAASNNLVAGYQDNTFKPNNTLTRAQILTILYAWADRPEVSDKENKYSDVVANNWYYAPAVWAYYAGIERGENGKFAQGTLCTRATFVLYLYRHMTGNCLLQD